jgi:fatty-acid desaturase
MASRTNETRLARHGNKINWYNGTFLVVAHVGTIVSFFFWSWPAVLTMVVLYWISGSLGIGMGFHRLITHRAYKVPKLLEYFLVTCGTLAAQGGPIQWTVTHRIHHAHTDRGDDPHSPRDGGFWAHVGWILRGTSQNHDQATIERYAPDLITDRYYVLLNRFFFVPPILLGVVLLIVGGWTVMLWGVFVRLTLVLQSTWLVNSATHLWGRTRFETGDDSRNSWWVALLTFGEGWHNNHHAYPTSARHGFHWYEIDFNWIGIRILQFFRLAHSVKRVQFNPETSEWQLVRRRWNHDAA